MARRKRKVVRKKKHKLDMYLVGKALVLLGLGALVATYLPQYDWSVLGAGLVGLGLLLKIGAKLKK